MGVKNAIPIKSVTQFEEWLQEHHAVERELWAAICKKASGKQTVGFDELLEIALCWGWVDVQTKGIDADRYAIRFVARRPGSNWSATNRAIVCRLISAGRMQPSGNALLPTDLTCP
jgi:uncharacterized protein YdeI (YjbR/CyaY-like superfamily)